MHGIEAGRLLHPERRARHRLHQGSAAAGDEQLKRLGSPNITHIPINQPRGCPVHNFQQDGHMAMRNPKGRVNCEPDSWERWENNPRESPTTSSGR